MFTQNENPIDLIDWFDDFEGHNDYAFLSNFYVGEPIDMGDGEGPVYKTGEHAFASYKANYRHDWERVVETPNAGKAKGIGRILNLRGDWEQKKFDVMACVLAAKFAPGRAEADMLLDTDDALLIEGTHWQDTIWGVRIPRSEDARANPDFATYGRNWLGRLLMSQRAILASDLADSVQQQTINRYTLIRCAPRFLKVP